MSSLTMALARFAAELDSRALPKEVMDWASRTFADTIACGLAGASDEAVHTLRAILPAGIGKAGLWGSNETGHVLNAAQINGVAAHALDFDDCHLVMDGHPSVSIVPGLFALAEERNSSGIELLTAYIAGLETELRLAKICNPAHADRGWHPTATFGVIGAAVACSHLLQLDQNGVATAIAIAASCSSGLRANSGTMAKPLHAAQATRNGLQAALLAEHGFSANLTALEHRFGFIAAYCGGPSREWQVVLAELEGTFLLLEPGIAIKQYPCCAFIHSAIDAAGQLRVQIDQPDDVTSVTVRLHSRRLRNIDRPVPKDGLDAKFSAQYLTARSLLQNTIGFSDFSAGAIADETVAALSTKVKLEPHEDGDLSFGQVEVVLADGRKLSAEDSVAMGRGPSNPLSDEQFADKFHGCTAEVLTHEESRRLLSALLALSDQPSTAAIGKLMLGSATTRHSKLEKV
ncbi:MmgE/PrpD family protein [Phyllobacterium phragmitis]|uniref:MmgE/PrpD family protein n=1 Tax=Phyllobacterium phragmitis TaxID=2670329 RepID=A0A2S9ISW5_9HYPH|nr:MmgE/PrpD family protein [Phyllobacterium phragmitis]PRD43614.1 MmgE/PrpD family protein [Phyllobacterium phragmitis]